MKYELSDIEEVKKIIEVHERVSKQVRFVAQALFIGSCVGMSILLWWLLV